MTQTDELTRPRGTHPFETARVRRRLGAVMIAVGVFGIVASMIGVIVGMQLVAQIDTALGRSLALTADSLRTVDASLQIAEDTVGLLGEGIGEAERTSRGLVTTIDEGEQALGSIADLTGTELADSLEAIDDSMPALIQVAAAIDTSLSALSQVPFGPPYDPERPFDESMRSLQDSLDGLPERLRDQAVLIDDASANLADLGTGTTAIADSLSELDAGLTQAMGLLQGYSATATQARELIGETERQLSRQATLARIMVAVVGLVIALGQIVPLYFGWLLRRHAEASILPAGNGHRSQPDRNRTEKPPT